MSERHASRRSFIKTAALGLMATAASQSEIHSALAKHQRQDVDPSQVSKILEIVQASKIIPEIADEVQRSGFRFELTPERVISVSPKDSWGGLHLRQFPESENTRSGIELAFTVNFESNSLAFAQILKTWCLANSTEISSLLYDPSLPFIEILSTHGTELLAHDVIRPIHQEFWSFINGDMRPLQPEEFVEAGWPPDLPDVTRWHYAQARQPQWYAQKDIQLIKFETVDLTRNNLADIETQTIQLSYKTTQINN